MVLSVHSRHPLFMCSFMWGISGLSTDDEKVMNLWLNSAVFFYLLLARKTVTRGSWVKLHKKPLLMMQMLDPTKLPQSTKSRLVKLHNSLGKTQWPSLVKQYSAPSKKRRKLDLQMLKVLGIEAKPAEKLLDHLYKGIVSSLRTMQMTMEAD